MTFKLEVMFWLRHITLRALDYDCGFYNKIISIYGYTYKLNDANRVVILYYSFMFVWIEILFDAMMQFMVIAHAFALYMHRYQLATTYAIGPWECRSINPEIDLSFYNGSMNLDEIGS